MRESVLKQWQASLLEAIREPEASAALRAAALDERLADWTTALTKCVVESCRGLGWHAAAKGHRLPLLPVNRCEYLAIDVMAFSDGQKTWQFPAAAFELENSRQDHAVAYSLWKVMCVRAGLRVVFCYRPQPDDGTRLVRLLQDGVISPLLSPGGERLQGDTVLVVGGKSESETFPYGFFKWWWLEKPTGQFRVM